MRVILMILLAVICFDATAQSEKGLVRKGNKEYDKGNFVDAQVDYLKAFEIDSTSYNAAFNLGAVLYKQERMENAEQVLLEVVKDSLSEHFSKSSFNLANTYLKQRKLEEAIAMYKKSLRVAPTDTLAKQNLAYAQQLLQNDNEQNDKDGDGGDGGDGGEGEDDQDKKESKDKGDKENEDKKEDKGKPDQNDGDKKDDKNSGQPKNQPGQMSKEEVDQLLEAIQANEDETQEKVKKSKAAGVKQRNVKNW